MVRPHVPGRRDNRFSLGGEWRERLTDDRGG